MIAQHGEEAVADDGAERRVQRGPQRGGLARAGRAPPPPRRDAGADRRPRRRAGHPLAAGVAWRGMRSGMSPEGRKRSTTMRLAPMRNSRTAATCTGLRPGRPAGDEARGLEEEHHQEGAHHRAGVVAGAAGGEREHDVDRDERHEALRGDVGRVVSVEGAGQAQHRRAHRECLHLERDHRLAGHRRHLVVVADGAEHAPVRRVSHALHGEQHDHHRRRGQPQIDEVEGRRR